MSMDGLPFRTVLIVDDEIPSRELLKMSFDWAHSGFVEVLEARNGAEALGLYRAQHPYLVITDIQMPVMDGLDLIRAIREIDAKQRVLVLSCHEDFHFAREALQMGVLDYILKDSYTPDSLQTTLARAMRQDGQERDRYHARSNPLRLLLEGNASEAEAQALVRSVHRSAQSFFVCAGRLNNVHIAAELLDGVLQRLYQMLDAQNGGDVFIARDMVYVLLCLPDTASAARRERYRLSLTEALQSLLLDCFGGVVPTGVSALCTRCEQLPQALKQAERALSNHIFLPDQHALFFDRIAESGSETEQQAAQETVGLIRQALGKGERAVLLQTLDELYCSLAAMRRLEALQHINAMLMSLLTQSCAANALSFEDIFGVERISLNMLDGLTTVDAIYQWFRARFEALLDALQSTLSPRIRQIVAYIDRHFCEDLSLENVAEHFGMHKVYLAKVFKDEKSMSVNEYIRTVRMEQAKLMLENDAAKISTVVEALGFNNAQTFYNLFKKHTGMSPSEYKTMCDLRRVAK